MNILIIGAMEEEIEYLVNNFEFKEIDQINKFTLYSLEQGNKVIYLLNSGIGKVNATLTLSMFLNTYKVEHILSIGTSGALSDDVEIGEIVNATELAYHDVDVSAFGYKIGKLPNNEKYFITSTNEFYKSILEKFTNYVTIHDGLIVTGDQFASLNHKKEIKNNFPKALAVEMESTAMVHTAMAFGININVLRVISDKASEDANIEFDKFLKEVCEKYKELLNIILNNI